MAYVATISFTLPNHEERVYRVRVQGRDLVHASLAADNICLGYIAGCGRAARILAIAQTERARGAAEDLADFLRIYQEIIRGNNS